MRTLSLEKDMYGSIHPVAAGASAGDPPRRAGDRIAESVADAAVAALVGSSGPLRALIIGPAGSGKTAVVEALRTTMRGHGRTVVAGGDDIPGGGVAIVDDLDTMDEDALTGIADLAADPDADVVVAFREHSDDRHRANVIARLERSSEVVLLGQVSAGQIVDAVGLAPACAEAIVTQTGGLTWLVSAAVEAHDAGSGACEADPDHHHLTDALTALIGYRLTRLAPPVRDAVELLCLLPVARIAATEEPPLGWERAIIEGWSTGVLTRSGHAPPLVRRGVRATLPAHRVPEVLAHAGLTSAADLDTLDLEGDQWDDLTRTGPIDARLLARGDAARATDPRRAMALYGEALSAGASAAEVGMRFAVAACGAGDLDTASACVDRILHVSGHPSTGDAIDASLAIWACRGALRAGVSSQAGTPATDGVSAARRAIGRLGVGALDAATETVAPPRGDTLAVASAALHDALVASLGPHVRAASDDLAVASELYSAANSDFPLVEPPAVIAAAAALACGRPDAAANALTSALESRQGGGGAHARLLLWQAWVAIVRGRPEAARAWLRRARGAAIARGPRDALIDAACEIALARRYGSAATLQTAFHAAEQLLSRQRFDLFLHPFLAELVLAAQRVDPGSAVERAFETELTALAAAGDPPLWSVPLHWAGVQLGIAQNRPELLAPHAHGLLTAAAHSPFAARLADAGRIWTDVLAGNVDEALVQQAAHTLAHDGMMWDGARLAAHGAARATDRAVAAQLLACARDLHPRTVTGSDGRVPPETDREEASTLSDRETEVARLVVQGKTYVEIGHVLFISPRTAEHHIARIRRRLNATSRSDLIAKLRSALDDTAPGREGAA